jgi:hypothetical protein
MGVQQARSGNYIMSALMPVSAASPVRTTNWQGCTDRMEPCQHPAAPPAPGHPATHLSSALACWLTSLMT